MVPCDGVSHRDKLCVFSLTWWVDGHLRKYARSAEPKVEDSLLEDEAWQSLGCVKNKASSASRVWGRCTALKRFFIWWLIEGLCKASTSTLGKLEDLTNKGSYLEGFMANHFQSKCLDGTSLVGHLFLLWTLITRNSCLLFKHADLLSIDPSELSQNLKKKSAKV